jgi:glycosyltransferase involved in cell wall biosynthesis
MKLSVLMTVYEEADFVDYAIKSILPYIDHLVIVEGAYQETIKLGKSPRSQDGTVEICKKYVDNVKVFYVEANEVSDPQQRNVGLNKVKELNSDGWLLLIDGDEIYDENTLKMVKIAAVNLEKTKRLAAYFTSMTFVDDFNHYTLQEFPRLFKLTQSCEFVNDNFMEWKDLGINWFSPFIVKLNYVKYWHYSFVKNRNRIELKKSWWETRFGRPFDYGWKFNSLGKLEDPNHKIMTYTGRHSEVLKSHPLWNKV